MRRTLTHSKETLRVLGDEDLALVAGGGGDDNYHNCSDDKDRNGHGNHDKHDDHGKNHRHNSCDDGWS